jgi:hypothetical protein
MLQVRIAGVGVAAGVALHSAYVLRERARAAPRRFSPASEDARVADSLATGDLVLFSRDATLYLLPGALVCALRRLRGGGGGAFDHAAIVVLERGEPFLLESSLSGGARLRPYEARICHTRSGGVAVRRLGLRLAPERAEAARAFARAAADTGAGAGAFGAPAAVLRELLALLADADANASVRLTERFYDEALGLRRRGGGSAPPLTMRELAPSAQPFEGAAFSREVWVRDRVV